MIYLTVLMNVKNENEAEFLKTAQSLIEATRTEKGCHAYYLTQMNSEQYNYVLHEAWESQEALDAHNNAEHFKKYVPQLDALSAELTLLVGKKVI